MSNNEENGIPQAEQSVPVAEKGPAIAVHIPDAIPEALPAEPEVVVPSVPEVPAPEVEVAPAAVSPQQQRPVRVSMTMGVDATAEPATDAENISVGPSLNPGVEQTMEYSTDIETLQNRKIPLTPDSEIGFFLAERSVEVDERIRTFINPTALETGKGADWNEAIQIASIRHSFIGNRFHDTTRQPGVAFKQFLQTESGKLGFTAPKIAEAGAAGYSGEKGIQRVRAIMGLGGIVSVPLWHSGFWFTMRAPSESSLIELFRRVQDEKIELGRETFGLVFSNEQSYINSYLLDFCIEHIYELSVRVDNNQEVRPLIKIQDMNVLFWGLACLVWPRGFDYVRSLTTKDGIENTETISAKINVGKLMWVDNAAFEDRHRAHMANRQRAKMTKESVLEYQKTFIPTLAAGRRVSIKPGLDILIASANVENYIADGEAWIAGIVQTVDSTFTAAAPSAEERNRIISMHSRANRLRNYGAWIKAIYIDEFENTAREDISETLTILSQDNEVTELIEKEVNKFMDDSTRALIAIPETSGKQMPLPHFPNLIPIDVTNTFFTLLAQRVNIINRR